MKFAHKIITAAAFITMTTGTAFAGETTQWTGRILDPTGGLPTKTSHFTLQVEQGEQTGDLLEVLKEQGPRAFEQQIEDMDQGWLKVGSGLATPIAAARVVENGDTQTVQVILDRPMALAEVANNTRSSDYPFTILQLEIGADGEGQGQMMAAADVEITEEGKLEVEHMGPMPWKLTHIKTR